jgi:hypothetical protein
MNEDALVAAILTAGVLIRMPGTGTISGTPERDRAARATEAVESYYAILNALALAKRAGTTRTASP